MDGQLFLSQASFATLEKSGRNRLSSSRGPLPNARAGDRGLAEVQSELNNFQNSVKVELKDMKAMVKQLLHEAQTGNTGGGLPPTSSEEKSTGSEDTMVQELVPTEQIVTMHELRCLPIVTTPSADVINAFATEVVDASP